MSDPDPTIGGDPSRPPRDTPSHPRLAGALLMIGVVVFLVVVSLVAVL